MTKITVTAAFPLTDEQKAVLENKFSDKYGEYTVRYVVNDALIGGIIIFDGERVYNGSISGRLERLREKLKGIGNE